MTLLLYTCICTNCTCTIQHQCTVFVSFVGWINVTITMFYSLLVVNYKKKILKSYTNLQIYTAKYEANHAIQIEYEYKSDTYLFILHSY